MIDLAPHHLETVKRILAEHLPGCEVRAFGSRATWTAWEYSDLDLAVVSPEPLAWDRRARLREAFEESDLPIRVDIVDWESLSDGFRQTIDGDCVILQEAATSRDWSRVMLRDVIDLTLSSVDKKTKPNEVPVQLCNYMDVYRNQSIHGRLDFMAATATVREIARCSLQTGDVLITKDSEKYDDIGVPALVTEDIPDLICGYHLAILRPLSTQLDGAYLFYALSTPQAQQQFHAYSNGVTRFGLRKADIGLVEIPLPPLHEQRRIARILGALDNKIELNRRISQTLEAMAQALFKSWFIDFDPVRAKAEGRPTNLPPHLDALFPDSFQDSELGEIPDGWQVGTIDDMCSRIENGGTPRRRESEYWGGTIDWFKTGELTDGPLLHSEERISDLGLAKSSCKLWPRGTILIALYASPTVGRLGILERPATANQACSALQAKPEFGEQFVFHTLFEARERLQNIAVGAAQQNISQQVVRDCSVVIPHHSVARAFSDISEPHYRQRVANVAEISTLAATRDALLTQLIPGNHGPDLVLQPTADSSTASAGTARSAYSSRI